MKNRLNEQIISIIKQRLPPDEQIAPFLMSILFLGKEAIYRRLRNDVSFTFDEIATISTKLGFSIDTVAGLNKSERVFFDTALYENQMPEEVYYRTMYGYVIFFAELLRSKTVSGLFVNNHIPYAFSVHFEALSKFRYYKLMHQRDGIALDCAMADMEVPAKIHDLHLKWREVMNSQKMFSTYIFDNNLFLTTCRDIDFFYKNSLLTKSEVEALQKDLLSLVDDFESMTATGVVPSGAPIHFYLLPFDLGGNCMNFEFDNNLACFIHIHSIDHVLSYDPNICELNRNWIDMIKRYSVFVSQSGEMLRLAYFKKQRFYINSIGQEHPPIKPL